VRFLPITKIPAAGCILVVRVSVFKENFRLNNTMENISITEGKLNGIKKDKVIVV